jgi:hypothetical protein
MLGFTHVLAQLDLTPLPHPGNTSQGTLIFNIINLALVVLGSVAVLIIVIAGIRYIVSRGDPQSINKAKNAIVYAIVGLVVALSASALVNFVLRGL